MEKHVTSIETELEESGNEEMKKRDSKSVESLNCEEEAAESSESEKDEGASGETESLSSLKSLDVIGGHIIHQQFVTGTMIIELWSITSETCLSDGPAVDARCQTGCDSMPFQTLTKKRREMKGKLAPRTTLEFFQLDPILVISTQDSA
ncbi:hypothetical protein BLNAU_6196 [Blattamonas nauphoetae]|uniref:Uncharacterized protein n=1 Tax=Blattamonas nauphoetae TaxID=2049346 RepID=A0ABQ9Y5B7_9EUKA|nr:hypothetical protein BLNAU_6196 [Blattamonas nauphoetae]